MSIASPTPKSNRKKRQSMNKQQKTRRGKENIADSLSESKPNLDEDSKSKRRGIFATVLSRFTDFPSECTKSTFVWAIISSALLFMAFPPIGLSGLAWVAPFGWLALIQKQQLNGKHPVFMLYVASVIHYLIVFHFVRLPHPAAYAGWVALSMYLAVYPAAFVLGSRLAHQRLKVPMLLACPTIWVALELLRGHLFTGLSLALLGHTQIDNLALIQISSITGAYGVSFIVMMVAASIFTSLTSIGTIRAAMGLAPISMKQSLLRIAAPILLAVTVLSAAIMFGQNKISEVIAADQKPVKFGLIQGSIDVIFPSAENMPTYLAEMREHYIDLTIKARQKHADLDVLVWPETMFPKGDFLIDDDQEIPAREKYQIEQYQSLTIPSEYLLASGTMKMNPEKLKYEEQFKAIPMIAGVGTYFANNDERRYNSAALFNTKGQITDRYFKMHTVPFGEFFPLGDLFPIIYQFAPIPGALTRGTEPKSFAVQGLEVAPNICFESIVPHVIRRQVAELREEGKDPDVLVNITNDGWFWGSSLLDLHLTSNVFRAIECRKPMLVCANTGFSAHIDGNGQIVQQGPRREPHVLAASVIPDGRVSFYSKYGDVFAYFCSFLAVGSFAGLFIKTSRN